MSCNVGHRHSSDLVLLWLWYRLAAIALIQPLAWEAPYAAGATLKNQKKKKSLKTKIAFYNKRLIHQEVLQLKHSP